MKALSVLQQISFKENARVNSRLYYLTEHLTLPAILLWAVIIRLWDLRQPFIGDYAWNEVYYAYIARWFFQGNLLEQYDIHTGAPVYSFPLVPWLIHGSFRLFGVVEWAARLPMLVFGLLALAILFLLVRILYDHRLALVATFLAAIVPGIVFFSRNVQLDGVMTTLGLGALLAMVIFRRNGQYIWLGISLLLFALAILAKYPAVLFWPALAWVWFDNGTQWRNRHRWLGLIIFTGIALVPTLLWITWSLSTLPVVGLEPKSEGLSARDYFFRFDEWSLINFNRAFQAIWSNSIRHLGSLIWYLGILLALFTLAKGQSRETLRKYILPILLIIPWFLQIVYPLAWIDNEYYDYPALYGACILLAAMGLAAFDQVATWFNLYGRGLRIVALLIVGLILFSNTWDYKESFHRSYYPWPLIEEPEPYYSARQVAAMNTDHKPVLTDVAFTLYYTGATVPDQGKYMWWFWSDDPIIEAIKSEQFEYIVFTYPPTIGIMNAIHNSKYEQFAPAAWHKLSDITSMKAEGQ